MSVSLGFNKHGKGRVRVVKVKRLSSGLHEVVQLNVQILLEGDHMENVYLTGDNSKVVATDTCKNTVYCLAKMHDFKSIEEFGIILCRHFLSEYAQIVNRVAIEIVKDKWERLNAPDSFGKQAPHNHTFLRIGPQRPYTKVQAEQRPGSPLKLTMQSGFRNLDILKTTQSGFVGFHRNKFTSLPEVQDRLLASSVTAEWDFNDSAVTATGTNFNEVSCSIEKELINTFAGPSDVGVFSASVQQTLYDMGKNAVLKVPAIKSITLEMPNIHNIPFNLEPYGFPKESGPPTIFFPIDEPHGMIAAKIERSSLGSGGVKSRL